MPDEDWVNWISQAIAASLNMFRKAIELADNNTWKNDSDNPQFWHIAFHTLFYTDFYYSTFDQNIINPEKEYRLPDFIANHNEKQWFQKENVDPVNKQTLIKFYTYSLNRLQSYFNGDLVNQVGEPSGFEWLPMTKGALLLYQMRHIMEHTAILNQILKKHGLQASGWQGLGILDESV